MKSCKYNIKQRCLSSNPAVFYTTINSNGGFDNFTMNAYEHYNCRSKHEAENRIAELNSINSDQILPFTQKILPNIDRHKCIYCNKEFTRQYNLARHQTRTCKENGLVKMKKQILCQQKLIDKLQSQTIQTQNIQNIQTQNIQNNNIQNNIIFEIGSENISDILTKKQKLAILKKMYGSLEYLVEHIHCNPKYPQFNNIQINSLSKSYCKTFSAKHKKFITTKTTDVLEKMVAHRTDDIQDFLKDAIDSGEPVPPKVENAIHGMVEKMENDSKYKKDKLDNIRLVLHNQPPI